MTKVEARAITPERFARYGSVVTSPSDEPTAATEAFKFWSDIAHYMIEGETEIGLCTVYRQSDGRVPWVERHVRTPEILIPVGTPFVLPVLPEDGPDSRVEAFVVRPGEAVVIGRGVWHSACHPIGSDEATYFVIFRRGTPHEDVTKRDIEDVVIAYG